jgi:Cu(I)/Ag(I) efflux system membrane fusion protein
MHSHIVQDHPGTCPICGMDLVLAGQSEAGAQVYVDTATQQKFGVRMASAERTSLAHEIHTYATLTPDVNTMQRITPTIDGTLVKLYATHPGQYIAAGKPLYDIFSQELLQLQNEYIDYLKRRSQSYKNAEETRSRNKQMMDSMHEQDPAGQAQIDNAMRQTEEQVQAMLQPMERDGLRLAGRLKSAGFSDAMLLQLASQRTATQVTTIPAQYACTVNEVSARAGMALAAMTDILTCVESRRAWLEVVFYPGQSSQVHEGETLQVQFADGTRTQTKLSGLSNITEGSARTIRARMPIKIADAQQLGGYADVTLLSSPHETLNVPVSAVIRTGHGDFVMRAMGNGHFMPQKIEIGISNDDRIEIRNGLEEGNQVALNGQFLLDAAASIADAAQRYEHSATAH